MSVTSNPISELALFKSKGFVLGLEFATLWVGSQVQADGLAHSAIQLTDIYNTSPIDSFCSPGSNLLKCNKNWFGNK